MKHHQKSEFAKYAELEEPIKLEELVAKITVDADTPHGLLAEWVSTYKSIRAQVVAKQTIL